MDRYFGVDTEDTVSSVLYAESLDEALTINEGNPTGWQVVTINKSMAELINKAFTQDFWDKLGKTKQE